MLEFEAYKIFKEQARGEIDEGQFTAALQDTVEHVLSLSYRTQPYTQVVPQALERLIEWYSHGLEYHVNLEDKMDMAAFVSTHTRGCVWAVLVRHGHESG